MSAQHKRPGRRAKQRRIDRMHKRINLAAVAFLTAVFKGEQNASHAPTA